MAKSKPVIHLAYRHVHTIRQLILEGDQNARPFDSDGAPRAIAEHPHIKLHTYLAEHDIIPAWPNANGGGDYVLDSADAFTDMDVDDWRALISAIADKILGARDRGNVSDTPSSNAAS